MTMKTTTNIPTRCSAGSAYAQGSARVGVGAHSGRGFTIIEAVIAIAAISLLGVAVVQVLRAAGSTVAAGSRISAITQSASQIERQLRADFESMTRDGFLLIRNEAANSGAAISTAPGDPNPRRRRIDEILFFAEGDHVSARLPVVAGLTARAPVAAVYYGHAQRRNPSDADFLQALNLSDDNAAAPRLGTGIATFASDWVLARRALLLAPPAQSPRPALLGAPAANQLDTNMQIGGQPAAAELFRTLNANASVPGVAVRGAVQRPVVASGLVDVVANDLASVRGVVLRGAPLGVNPFQTVTGGLTSPQLAGAQAAMRDALPANSDGNARMRVEIDPPNLLGFGETVQSSPQRADQLMLTTGAFAPRCTEFIVEWSFGEVDTGASDPRQAGRLVWHGLSRDIVDPASGLVVQRVRPYGQSGAGAPAFRAAGNPDDPNPELSLLGFRTPDGGSALRYVPPALIHLPATAPTDTLYSFFAFTDPTWQPRLPTGTAPNPTPPNQSTEPDAFLWPPLRQRMLDERARGVSALLVDTAPINQFDADRGDRLRDPETIAWKWPSLVRVTITLADPVDAKTEQTFQYVFRVPSKDVDNVN